MVREGGRMRGRKGGREDERAFRNLRISVHSEPH